MEQLLVECRKTKVITLANHNGHRQYSEPMKSRSNYMSPTRSAGQRRVISAKPINFRHPGENLSSGCSENDDRRIKIKSHCEL